MTDEGPRAILRGHCPNCDADLNAEVLAEDTLEEEDEASGVWVRSTHSILRCLGCDRRYFRLAELCSEDWDEDFDADTGGKRSVSGPVQAAARVALNGCQFQGRSSAIRRAGWSAMRTSTSVR
jgi:hypothetical protein